MRLSLLLLLVAATAALAGPQGERPEAVPGAGSASVIKEPEFQDRVEEQEQLLFQLARKQLKPEDLLARYENPAPAAKTGDRRHAIDVFLYGRALHRMGRTREAREQYEKALRAFERFPRVHLALGDLANQAGDRREAAREFKRARKIDRGNYRASINLGRLELEKKDYGRALRYFESAQNLQPSPGGCIGVMQCHLQFWVRVYNEEKKAFHKDQALRAARLYRFLEPTDARGFMNLARVHKVTRDLPKAAAALEKGVEQEEMPEAFRREFLLDLVDLYARMGRDDKVGEALRKVLKLKQLPEAMRKHVKQMLKDLETKGEGAFAVWVVRRQRELLANEGEPLDARVDALQGLLDLLLSPAWVADPKLDEEYKETRATIFRTCFGGAPELLVPVLGFIRDTQDERALGLVVHCIYPRVNERNDQRVRLEAVRTIAAMRKIGVLPILLHCRNDDDLTVLRAVDSGLSNTTGRRSPMDEGIEALTEEQRRVMRRFWLDYARSPAGGRQLAQAFGTADAGSLRTMIKPPKGRGARNLPLTEHVLAVVLDNDIPFEAWKQAYLFLEDYFGTSFRAVDRRDRELEANERAAVVVEVDEAFRK
ncbi:MAG: tetratricopeptide repeat protein [Planctomycetota bacterium]|nr:tetratricopeptide repeat protein [Planctomycetota bacterium]